MVDKVKIWLWRRYERVMLWFDGAFTFDKRHIKDCMWFLAKESPTNARDFPLTSSRNQEASKRGSSQAAGLHLHFRKSMSGLPYFMQFWCSWIVKHVRFV